jgi:hypothetical protein
VSNRKKYTVLVPFPKAGGHWAAKGETLDLLAVEAQALRQAGRIKLTAELEAEAQAAAAETAALPAPTTKKATAKE